MIPNRLLAYNTILQMCIATVNYKAFQQKQTSNKPTLCIHLFLNNKHKCQTKFHLQKKWPGNESQIAMLKRSKTMYRDAVKEFRVYSTNEITFHYKQRQNIKVNNSDHRFTVHQVQIILIFGQEKPLNGQSLRWIYQLYSASHTLTVSRRPLMQVITREGSVNSRISPALQICRI